jgi:glycosyltransferase involved in cell wall biosynthesis
MRVSVIVSTYNAADWLEKVLWGFAVQTRPGFELLVADDGSTSETAERIERMREETGLALGHVWHEDRGFRKCTILNRAIAASTGEYLIFTDGDCIPRRDFVARHVELARPGAFLSGGAVRLPMDLSLRITREDIVAGRATDARWLRDQGMPWSRKLWMLQAGKWGGVLDRLTTTRATWNGGNASAWRSDLVRANGYDERMEHGGLDRELGERLVNAGLRGRQIRHRAVCVHLDHARGYARGEAVARNLEIRARTRAERVVRTPYGIVGDEPAGERSAA